MFTRDSRQARIDTLIGKAARVQGDVDFRGGTITIRQTKFYKTRILPLPDSVIAELRAYLGSSCGSSHNARKRRWR